MRQGENESDTSYMKRFRVNLDTLISAGGRHILCSPDLVEAVDKDNVMDSEKEAEESKFKAMIFLKRSHQGRYGEFLTELQNSAHLNRDEYPESETDALDLMVRRLGLFMISIISSNNRNGQVMRSTYRRGGCGHGYNFAQNVGCRGNENRAPPGTILVQGVDGRTCNVLCFRCQTWGHYTDNCPNENGNNNSTSG